MAVDYDLVILGGTPEGYEAARYGASLGARVALVLQGLDGRRSPLQTLGTLGMAPSFLKSSAAIARSQSPWQYAIQRAALIAETLTSDDFQRLMVQGVYVIAEVGQIVSTNPLQVDTPSRQFKTRGILLATGSLPQTPAIAGLESVPYETPEAFLKRQTLPKSAAIVGSTPLALSLCQLLCRWRVSTTLITPNPSLLGQEEPEVSRWLTAQLQAEGAVLHLAATLTKVVTDGSMIALQLGEASVRAEALIVANSATPNVPDIQENRLLKRDRALAVSPYLQTSHPRIYACGAVLGGYAMPAIALQEARVATENALFWNRRRIDYVTIPYDLPIQPGFARAGLTELQAQQRYDAAMILVSQQPLYDNPKAQWLASTTGFCKLIAHRNGQILGVHGVGPEASEWVQTIALLMAQKVPWWAIAQCPALPHSLSDILHQTTQQWIDDRWLPGQWRRDWAENWFNWRRSR